MKTVTTVLTTFGIEATCLLPQINSVQLDGWKLKMVLEKNNTRCQR